eukprot:7092964-Alexandrium_andersonii.AAC.1
MGVAVIMATHRHGCQDHHGSHVFYHDRHAVIISMTIMTVTVTMLAVAPVVVMVISIVLAIIDLSSTEAATTITVVT